MKETIKTYQIKAHPADVWRALTDKDQIEEWSGAPCLMEAEENFQFSLWNGDIWGENIEVIAGKKLVQNWYAGQWEQPSVATFTLKETADGTELKLVHQNIPDAAFAEIETGWDDHYLIPLKNLAERTPG